MSRAGWAICATVFCVGSLGFKLMVEAEQHPDPEPCVRTIVQGSPINTPCVEDDGSVTS